MSAFTIASSWDHAPASSVSPPYASRDGATRPANAVIDVQDPQLHAPVTFALSDLEPTAGLQNKLTSKLNGGNGPTFRVCEQHATVDCPLGPECADAHVNRAALNEVRTSILRWLADKEHEFGQQVAACGGGSNSNANNGNANNNNMISYKIFCSDLKEIVDVPATSITFTRGLFADPGVRTNKRQTAAVGGGAAAAAPINNGKGAAAADPTSATASTPTACGLFASDPTLCKWGKWCNQAHIDPQFLAKRKQVFSQWAMGHETTFNTMPASALFLVHDPVIKRSVDIPRHDIAEFTRGLFQQSGATPANARKAPSLCLLYQKRRCTAGACCNQIHVRGEAVAVIRTQSQGGSGDGMGGTANNGGHQQQRGKGGYGNSHNSGNDRHNNHHNHHNNNNNGGNGFQNGGGGNYYANNGSNAHQHSNNGGSGFQNGNGGNYYSSTNTNNGIGMMMMGGGGGNNNSNVNTNNNGNNNGGNFTNVSQFFVNSNANNNNGNGANNFGAAQQQQQQQQGQGYPQQFQPYPQPNNHTNANTAHNNNGINQQWNSNNSNGFRNHNNNNNNSNNNNSGHVNNFFGPNGNHGQNNSNNGNNNRNQYNNYNNNVGNGNNNNTRSRGGNMGSFTPPVQQQNGAMPRKNTNDNSGNSIALNGSNGGADSTGVANSSSALPPPASAAAPPPSISIANASGSSAVIPKPPAQASSPRVDPLDASLSGTQQGGSPVLGSSGVLRKRNNPYEPAPRVTSPTCPPQRPDTGSNATGNNNNPAYNLSNSSFNGAPVNGSFFNHLSSPNRASRNNNGSFEPNSPSDRLHGGFSQSHARAPSGNQHFNTSLGHRPPSRQHSYAGPAPEFSFTPLLGANAPLANDSFNFDPVFGSFAEHPDGGNGGGNGGMGGHHHSGGGGHTNGPAMSESFAMRPDMGSGRQQRGPLLSGSQGQRRFDGGNNSISNNPRWGQNSFAGNTNNYFAGGNANNTSSNGH